MKYLVILYASYNNGTSDKKAIYEMPTKDEAIASFHTYLGTYMKDETVKHAMVIAADTDGFVYKNEVFDRGEN